MPPVVASPWAAVASFSMAQVAPPPTRAVRRSGSTRTWLIADRSATIAPSPVPYPGTLCPPPRTARAAPLSCAPGSIGRQLVMAGELAGLSRGIGDWEALGMAAVFQSGIAYMQ